jgi:hypothetical protein
MLSVASPAGAKATKIVGTSRCADATGDGQGADLATTVLTADKRGLLTIIWETPVLPNPTDSGRYVLMAGPKGNPAYQIGLKVSGNTVTKFVFNFHTNKQRNLNTAARIGDQGSTLTVPLSALPNLGKHPTWAASLTSGDVDADRCPEGALATVTFGKP